MPCREETVPFQREDSKIAANKKPSYCDTSIQTPTRIPWQAVWLLTSFFLLFLHRAPTSHPHRQTSMQWQRKPAGVCLDCRTSRGAPVPSRREASLLWCRLVQVPVTAIWTCCLFSLSFCCRWQYLARQWVKLTSWDERGDHQMIFHLPIQKCHGSVYLGSEDKESRTWLYDSD